MKRQKNQIIAIIIAIGCCALLGGCKASVATGSSAAVEPFFKFEKGLALKGYDPVAYFIGGKPETGRGEFEAEYKGAKWHFANAQNREMFLSAPEKYAPQYGGYCAWAVAHGYTAKGDPEAWKIVDGKLYLNYNQDVKQKWEQDIPAYIKELRTGSRFKKPGPNIKGKDLTRLCNFGSKENINYESYSGISRKVNSQSASRAERAADWLAAFQEHLGEAGLNHISEIFDADRPHTPRGCVAQAWSVAELLRAAVEDLFSIKPSK